MALELPMDCVCKWCEKTIPKGTKLADVTYSGNLPHLSEEPAQFLMFLVVEDDIPCVPNEDHPYDVYEHAIIVVDEAQLKRSYYEIDEENN